MPVHSANAPRGGPAQSRSGTTAPGPELNVPGV